MRHAKRKKLTSEDFNKALRWSDVEVSIDVRMRIEFCLMNYRIKRR